MSVYFHFTPSPQVTAWRLETLRHLTDELSANDHSKVPTHLVGFIKHFALPDALGPRTARRATYKFWQAFVRWLLMMFVCIIVAFILDTQTPLGDFLAPLPFILGFIVAVLLVMGSAFYHWMKLWRNFRVPQQTLTNDFRIDLRPYIKKYNSARKNPHAPEFELACQELAYAMLWFQSRNPLTPYGLYQPTAEVAVAPRPYDDPNNAYSPSFMETIYRGNTAPSLDDLFKHSANERSPRNLLRSLGVPFDRVLVRAALGWLFATIAVFVMSMGNADERGLVFALVNSILLGLSVGLVLLARPMQNKIMRQQIRLACDNPAGAISLGSLHQALRIELIPVLEAYKRGEVSAEILLQAHTLFMGRYPVNQQGAVNLHIRVI